MKKRVISLLLAIIMVFSVLAMTVSATNYSSEETSDGVEMNRGEQVEWYFRTYNGVRQMRLWSITYGHWITDWIDC